LKPRIRISNENQNSTPKKSDSGTPKSDTFSIFILKANKSSLVQAEAFLRNRKWTVGSSTNIKEALGYIIQKNPQYVLISADHPHKKVKILPKMLAQAFPIRVIAFAETSSSNSSKSLTAMGLEYNLYPPVSGPAIERIVLKIIRDAELKAQTGTDGKTQFATGTGAAGSDAITLRGGETANGENNSSFDQARAALMQMMTGDGDDSLSNSGVMIQKGGNQLQHSTSQDGTESGAGGFADNKNPSATNGSGYTPEHNADKTSSNMDMNPGLGANSLGSSNAMSPNNKSSLMASMSQETSAETHSAFANAQNPAAIPNPQASDQIPKAADNGQSMPDDNEFSGLRGSGPASPRYSGQSSKKQKPLPVIEARTIQKQEKRTRYFAGLANPSNNESVIVRGTQTALDESVNVNGPKPTEEIEVTTRLACITVQSPRFSGYLLTAVGQDSVIDQDFIELIRKRLYGFLKENGEQVKEQESMEVKLQLVDFVDWSIEQAQFLRKSVHNGKEVVMAFFPDQNLRTEFDVTDDQEMLKMSLDELKADTPVEFDLYIHMPENDKYILYTPKGAVFYGHQKTRLKEKGLENMHLKKEARMGLVQYRAQNYLNSKIDEYQNTENQAPGSLKAG